MNEACISPIAKIYNDYSSKFAIPRQSGIADEVISEIVFEKDYRNDDCLKGIEEFSHLWLIWGFSEIPENKWSPTVRPPRLGGNIRKGVFATRSPFRPNRLGLSSVELFRIEKTCDKGTVLLVKGADIMSGSPIYDIKPYLPYVDIHSDATGGFTDSIEYRCLNVVIPDELILMLDDTKKETLIKILSQDPRPSYHDDEDRVYGFAFADMEIKFTVSGDVLNVVDIYKIC